MEELESTRYNEAIEFGISWPVTGLRFTTTLAKWQMGILGQSAAENADFERAEYKIHYILHFCTYIFKLIAVPSL